MWVRLEGGGWDYNNYYSFYCGLCFFSSLKIARQILDAHSSMLNMSLIDAKMQYIRNWQALQGFGITYFVIKSGKSKKDVRRQGWKREGRKGRRERGMEKR